MVGLTGEITRQTSTNGLDDAARGLGTTRNHLTAPIHCTSPEARDPIPLSDEFADVPARTETAGLELVSCGPLALGGSLMRIRMVKHHLDDVLRRGAAGELLEPLPAARKRPVPRFLDESIVALPPDKPPLTSASVPVAGGPEKARTVRAVLRAGHVHRLATNEGVAQALPYAPGRARPGTLVSPAAPPPARRPWRRW